MEKTEVGILGNLKEYVLKAVMRGGGKIHRGEFFLLDSHGYKSIVKGTVSTEVKRLWVKGTDGVISDY